MKPKKTEIEFDAEALVSRVEAFAAGTARARERTVKLPPPVKAIKAKGIRAIRERLGFTQVEFAALLNVPKVTAVSWENGAAMLRAMKHLIGAMILSVWLAGCASVDKQAVRGKVALLRPGMAQTEVVRLFGNPSNMETKQAGFEFGRGFSGFRFDPRTEDQLVWEYDREDLAITFVWSGKGWVVRLWTLD